MNKKIMKKILFVYDHNKPEQLEFDGLWSALKLLEADFEVDKYNMTDPIEKNPLSTGHNFILGWGAFGSRVDEYLRQIPESYKKGLCLAAYMEPNENSSKYDVIFYETEFQRKFLAEKGIKTILVHGFGVNTDVYHKMSQEKVGLPIWDNISVGSFSKWHRQDLLYDIPGYNLAVGNMGENLQESFNFVANLLLKGWTVSNFVPAKTLVKLYNMSKECILTAEFGQERACLEARACGLKVKIPPKNPKLLELLKSPIWDSNYYCQQLKGGILNALRA